MSRGGLLAWRRELDRLTIGRDLLAGAVIAAMLVPQGMAYASLAGLPPQVGLYASLLPPVAYALFASSRYLAVGPVAVVSLMVATATSALSQRHGLDPVLVAPSLALLSGAWLLLMGSLRLGFLTYFLSRPVLTGFLAAAAVLIAVSQLPQALGFRVDHSDPVTVLEALLRQLDQLNPWALAVTVGTILVILLVNGPVGRSISRTHRGLGKMVARMGALVALLLGIAWVSLTGFSDPVAVIGEIPASLPDVALPPLEMAWMVELAGMALLISLVGFMESVSIGRALAARDGEGIGPNRELLGLGAANLAAGLTSAYPVTGGLSRSIVAADAGARTPLAGVFAAAFVLLVLLFATPLLENLPRAVLAGIVLLAVVQLLSPHEWKGIWRKDWRDGVVLAMTAGAVLVLGVELGLVVGIAASIAVLLWRVSRPHVAVVGRIPGTEHFRNRERHSVEEVPGVRMLRVDESLQFPNSQVLRDTLLDAGSEHGIQHLVLIGSGINDVDATALEALEEAVRLLRERGVCLHLAEIKGPVMDRLERIGLPQSLYPGRIFLSTHEAAEALRPRSNQDPTQTSTASSTKTPR